MKVYKYGDNVDTDVIIPARYLNAPDEKSLASHCMEDIDAGFASTVEPGDIIVAGANFGCGSSREHAPLAIKACGVKCVIAPSFARIFYRNAINIGFPILECAEAAEGIQAGDTVSVDFGTGVITDETTGKTYQAAPLPAFVQGIVDTPDLSLNISREMLQHDRQLKIIANNIEKKVKNELVKLMKDDRTKYEQFWAAFGMQFKYALMNSYGQNRDTIRDLLLFWSSKENKLTSLKEYVDRMPTSQEKIYYVCADSVDHASKMPQAERVLKAGYEVLYLTVDEDEIVLQMLENAYDKPFISVANEDALPVTDAEKASAEQAEKDHKDLLDFAQETLKGYVSKVRISKILKSGTVCLTADGPVSLEMEKYFHKMRRDFPMSAEKVLELNPESPAFQALCKAYDEDKEKAKNYIQVLYYQALIIADLPLPDPAHYAELVCGLMQ